MAVAILPCAGSSRRMGRPKLLLPFRGDTVLGSLISALHSGGVTELVVVTRSADQTLQAWCSRKNIPTAVNPDPRRGMLSSVIAGLTFFGGADELMQRGEDLLVCPGDYPGLEPNSILQLRDRLRSLESGLVVPTCRGRRGHPLLISKDLALRIGRLDPEKGLQELLEIYPDRVCEVAVDDPATVQDLDTPADYEKLLREL